MGLNGRTQKPGGPTKNGLLKEPERQLKAPQSDSGGEQPYLQTNEAMEVVMVLVLVV